MARLPVQRDPELEGSTSAAPEGGPPLGRAWSVGSGSVDRGGGETGERGAGGADQQQGGDGQGQQHESQAGHGTAPFSTWRGRGRPAASAAAVAGAEPTMTGATRTPTSATAGRQRATADGAMRCAHMLVPSWARLCVCWYSSQQRPWIGRQARGWSSTSKGGASSCRPLPHSFISSQPCYAGTLIGSGREGPPRPVYPGPDEDSAVHAGYTPDRQPAERSGHQRSRRVARNHRSTAGYGREQAAL